MGSKEIEQAYRRLLKNDLVTRSVATLAPPMQEFCTEPAPEPKRLQAGWVETVAARQKQVQPPQPTTMDEPVQNDGLVRSVVQCEHRILDREDRILRARISTKQLDGHGTVILPSGGRFDDYVENPVVLFNHNPNIILGNALRYMQTEDYVDADWKMFRFDNPSSEIGRMVEDLWLMVEQGVIRGYSAAFPYSTAKYTTPKPNERIGPGHTRTFIEWWLKEFSLTPVPSNPGTLSRSTQMLQRWFNICYGADCNPNEIFSDSNISVETSTVSTNTPNFASVSNTFVVEPKDEVQSDEAIQKQLDKAFDGRKVRFCMGSGVKRGLVTGDLAELVSRNGRTIHRISPTNKANYLPHLATKLFDQPLAIAQDKLEVILSVLSSRIGLEQSVSAGGFVTEDARDRSFQVVNRVAIIPVLGTLVQRSFGLQALSGLTSYHSLESAFVEALEDRGVDAIALDIDSPGGEVKGLFDFADRVYAARGEKPIWAVVNEHAFSAAYAIASAADRVLIPRTGGVGSVGVVSMHVDQSKRDETEGIAFTYVFAGDKKVDGNSHEPLSDRAETDMQKRVDDTYSLFARTVARNRGISEEAVRGTEAGVFWGEDAITAGFADEILGANESLSRLADSLEPAIETSPLDELPDEQE